MRLLGAMREARFRAKLLVGLAVLGAAAGALALAHFYFMKYGVVDAGAGQYLRVIWRWISHPEARELGLHLELAAAAAIGALVLVLPVLLVFLKSGKKGG